MNTLHLRLVAATIAATAAIGLGGCSLLPHPQTKAEGCQVLHTSEMETALSGAGTALADAAADPISAVPATEKLKSALTDRLTHISNPSIKATVRKAVTDLDTLKGNLTAFADAKTPTNATALSKTMAATGNDVSNIGATCKS